MGALVAGKPGMGALVAGEPGMGALVAGEPGMGALAAGEPGMGALAAGEPGMGALAAGEPGAGEPGMGEPGDELEVGGRGPGPAAPLVGTSELVTEPVRSCGLGTVEPVDGFPWLRALPIGAACAGACAVAWEGAGAWGRLGAVAGSAGAATGGPERWRGAAAEGDPLPGFDSGSGVPPLAGVGRLAGTFGSDSPRPGPSRMASIMQSSPRTFWMAWRTLSICGPRWKAIAFPGVVKARMSLLPSIERGFASTFTLSQVIRLIFASSSIISGQARRTISI